MLFHKLHRLGQMADQPFVAADIRARQYAVLKAIADSSTPTIQTDLVRMTGVDRSTLAGIVRRLEKTGMVTRKRGKTSGGEKDDRCVVVTLTATGRTYINRADSIASKTDQFIMDRIKPAHRAAFLKAIDDILSPAAA